MDPERHVKHEKEEREIVHSSEECYAIQRVVLDGQRQPVGGEGMNHEKHEKHEKHEMCERVERDKVLVERDKVLFREECYAIQGAVFEVYREIGSGFLEAVYQECMEKEMRSRRIPFVAQHELRLSYKGILLEQTYKPDFICFNSIIIELKAIKELTPQHEAQAINYLKATDMKLALLVNFGSYPKATIKRLVL